MALALAARDCRAHRAQPWFRQLELYVIPVVPLALVAVGALLVATHGSRRLPWGLPRSSSLPSHSSRSPRLVHPVPRSQAPLWPNPRYDLAIGNLGRDGLDLQELAVELIEALPKWEDDPGTLLFWYQSGDSTLLDSIQSTYLWRSSAVQGFDFPAMPSLNDQQRTFSARRPPRHIALLGYHTEQVSSGRQALASIGLVPVAVKDATLRPEDGPCTSRSSPSRQLRATKTAASWRIGSTACTRAARTRGVIGA